MNIRYDLGNEISVVLSLAAFVASVLFWLLPVKCTIKKGSRGLIAFLCMLLLGAIIGNYYSMKDYTEMPYVVSLTYYNAQNVLGTNSLNVRAGGVSVVNGDCVVESQSNEAGEILKKGTTVYLELFSEDRKPGESSGQVIPTVETQNSETPTSITPAAETQNLESPTPVTPTTEISGTGEGSAGPNTPLEIVIDSYSIFYDGYHYEEPEPDNPNSYWVIDFDKGVCGTFHYSRPLTEIERGDWAHGGKLYDSKGTEIGLEGNFPQFWSDSIGHFAMKFPDNLSSGQYTYEIYQYINGNCISATIEFSV